VKGRGLSFQVAIQSLMSFSRAWTEVWTPRRISLSVSSPNHRSINRPWGAGSSAGACSGVSGEPVEVFLDARDDA
jgi:hypothetical protein